MIMFGSPPLPASFSGPPVLGAAFPAAVAVSAWLVVVAGTLAVFSLAIVLRRHPKPAGRSAPTKPAGGGERLEPGADRPKVAERAEQDTRATSDERAENSVPHSPGTDAAQARPAHSVDLITDPETGLFNQVFFEASLVKRISAARRGLRPLSVAVADVVVGVGSSTVSRAPAAPVAATMVNVFREADTLAHSDDGLFLILLEDTPEDGAVWLLERFRHRLTEDLPGHTLRVGISCYPTHGFQADKIASQARAALASAREWQQDRIEVTNASPDE